MSEGTSQSGDDVTRARVAAYFNSIALDYNRLIAERNWKANDVLNEALGGVALEGCQVAFDLAAGTGATTAVLLDKVPSLEKILAVDISEPMLELLKHRFADNNKVIPELNSIEAFLDKTDVMADIVTAMGAQYFMPRPEDFIRAIAARLNPRGYIAFTYDPYIQDHPLHGERQTDTGQVIIHRRSRKKILQDLRRHRLTVLVHQLLPPTTNAEYQNFFVLAQKQEQAVALDKTA